MNPNKKWDDRFTLLAEDVSEWSKDPSSKIGVVVVDDDRNVRITAYNGPPRGVNDDVPERWERPEKYKFCSHAEENAVCTAARMGVSIDGCTMYLSGLPPCCNCARMIIQSGIKRLVVSTMDIPERWKEYIEAALVMLEEASVKLDVLGE